MQVNLIEWAEIEQSQLSNLLYESVLTFNVDLFDGLLDYGVHVTDSYEQRKTLLHFCAKIPDHNLAATRFAPRLLELGAV